MSKVTSNINQGGIESIRIGGMLIDDLPIAEAAYAKQQLPQAIETQRQHEIADIKAEYPTQTIEYLEGAIRDCFISVERINDIKAKEAILINEYTATIALCKHRDAQILKHPEQKRELEKQFPPYNVEAMQQQISQSTESINRCDSVIAQEYKTISELKEILGLCHQRDIKLKNLGVDIR